MTTTLLAARYAREASGKERCTLVIGKEEGAVCEGFPPEDIEAAIAAVAPASVILVGEGYDQVRVPDGVLRILADDLDEGKQKALRGTVEGCIVLSVKSWR
jgi:hypothetical protein